MQDSFPEDHYLEGLPHGVEFRFVDHLIAIDPGQSGEGIYRIRGDEAFLAGHFPGRPMMPGVVLVEAVAQLGGVIVQADPSLRQSGLLLTAIRAAKITGSAEPGQTLRLRAEVEGSLGGLFQVSGSVEVLGSDSEGRTFQNAVPDVGGSLRPVNPRGSVATPPTTPTNEEKQADEPVTILTCRVTLSAGANG